MENTLVDLAAQTNQHTAGSKEMNKQTGLLGKEASWTKKTDTPLTPMKNKAIINTLNKKKKWKQQHPNFDQSDSFHKLNRPQQVIPFWLRTGHNRLNAHMYSKFKAGKSEMCPYDTDIITAHNLLQHC